LKILGQYRVPFAIKGGGHTYKPSFSSTKGIHINMKHFQKIVYHENNQTVDMGAGVIWDDVHRILDGYNVNVIGGQVSGVGVAGLILGGGYSWKTNQYGLAMDNVFEYQVKSIVKLI
jgi:FAD/FMN-containing dehydrogenase